MVFRSQSNRCTVTLFPMVHVGESRFYTETYADAFSHDVVLIEGVKSPVVRNLTKSYRWINLEKLGLVRQLQPPSASVVTARIVKADLSSEEFHQEWKKIPFHLRLVISVAAPIIGFHRRLFASRESLAKTMSLEDKQSAKEILDSSSTFEPLSHAIIHARDARLIQRLATELDAETSSDNRIAVVFGAQHMRSEIRALSQRGFHSLEGTWQTIFST